MKFGPPMQYLDAQYVLHICMYEGKAFDTRWCSDPMS